jgi:hypothetical protein
LKSAKTVRGFSFYRFVSSIHTVSFGIRIHHDAGPDIGKRSAVGKISLCGDRT